jgi:hypothetical protein
MIYDLWVEQLHAVADHIIIKRVLWPIDNLLDLVLVNCIPPCLFDSSCIRVFDTQRAGAEITVDMALAEFTTAK